MNLPTLKAGDTCPNSPGNTAGFDYGTGPVYVMGGPESLSPWGYYFYVSWVTAPDLSGPVLVRGRDLMSNRIVVFVGAYSAGAVVGTDTLAGSKVSQRAELLLEARPKTSTRDSAIQVAQIRVK